MLIQPIIDMAIEMLALAIQMFYLKHFYCFCSQTVQSKVLSSNSLYCQLLSPINFMQDGWIKKPKKYMCFVVLHVLFKV